MISEPKLDVCAITGTTIVAEVPTVVCATTDEDSKKARNCASCGAFTFRKIEWAWREPKVACSNHASDAFVDAEALSRLHLQAILAQVTNDRSTAEA